MGQGTDTDLLRVETDAATYVLHGGSHGRATQIPDATMRHVDGVVLESGSMGPHESLSTDDLRKEQQYGDLIQQSMDNETDIFVVDVPYTCSDLRVLLEGSLGLGLPFLAGLFGMLHVHIGFSLLMLPAIGFAIGGAPSRRMDRVASYAQLSGAYTAFGFRSAVAAEKLEQQVAPQLREDTGTSPIILIDYGSGHLDIAAYLQHPRLRRAVIAFGTRALRGTLDMDYVDRVSQYRFDTAVDTAEHVVYEGSF